MFLEANNAREGDVVILILGSSHIYLWLSSLEFFFHMSKVTISCAVA